MDFLPKVIVNLSDIEKIGLTITGEARGEPIEGQVAVGSVIRNRLYSNPQRYKSWSEVVFEPYQFSCWNRNDPNYGFLNDLAQRMILGQRISDVYIRQCLYVAAGIVTGEILDNIKHSKYYIENTRFAQIDNDPRLSWARNHTDPIVIHNHSFFNI